MNARWFCIKCNSWNSGEKTRCSFCSEPRLITTQQDIVEDEGNKITQQLHNIIEKLTLIQKRKLYRWLEDNIL